MRFEVEVYRNEAGEWVAEAVEYKVTVTGRTENEALARMMEALTLHFKTKR
jgi:predicted RNase H-like HicB family nuclease